MKKPTSLLQNWRSLGNINSRWQPLVPQESVSLGKASQQSRSAFISVSSHGIILYLQGSWNHETSEVNDAWVSIIHQPQGCWVRRECAGKEVHVCLIANLPQELTTGFYFFFVTVVIIEHLLSWPSTPATTMSPRMCTHSLGNITFVWGCNEI